MQLLLCHGSVRAKRLRCRLTVGPQENHDSPPFLTPLCTNCTLLSSPSSPPDPPIRALRLAPLSSGTQLRDLSHSPSPPRAGGRRLAAAVARGHIIVRRAIKQLRISLYLACLLETGILRSASRPFPEHFGCYQRCRRILDRNTSRK
jgi:hypothetical protein